MDIKNFKRKKKSKRAILSSSAYVNVNSLALGKKMDGHNIYQMFFSDRW